MKCAADVRNVAGAPGAEGWRSLGVAVGLGLLWLLLPGGIDVLGRLPWLDELHSIRIMQEPSVARVVDIVAKGGDPNPPLYHLFGRFLLGLPGIAPVPGLRIAALVFMGLALAFTHASLRRSFDRSSAFIGLLAMWAHPLASRYAFEARFYAPWLAFTAGTLWFVLRRTEVRTAWNAAGLALFSALLCGIHYFGIISFALILAGGLLLRRGAIRQMFAVLLPAAAGPAALLACAPILWRQKQAYGVATWVDPPDFASSVTFVLDQIGAPQLALIAVFIGISGVIRSWRSSRAGGLALEIHGTPPAPSICLLAMSPAIVIFSYVVQPSLIGRYAIPGILGTAALGAFMAAGTSRMVRPLLMVGLVAWGVFSFRQTQDEVLTEAREHAGRVRILAGTPEDIPIVFARRHHQWPAIFALPRIENRAYYLSLADAEMPRRTDMEVIERDLAWIFFRHSGRPLVASLAEARQNARFIFVARDFQGSEIPALFPGFAAEALGSRTFQLTARHTVVAVNASVGHRKSQGSAHGGTGASRARDWPGAGGSQR